MKKYYIVIFLLVVPIIFPIKNVSAQANVIGIGQQFNVLVDKISNVAAFQQLGFQNTGSERNNSSEPLPGSQVAVGLGFAVSAYVIPHRPSPPATTTSETTAPSSQIASYDYSGWFIVGIIVLIAAVTIFIRSRKSEKKPAWWKNYEKSGLPGENKKGEIGV